MKKIILAIFIILQATVCFGQVGSRNLDNSGDRITQGDIFDAGDGESISLCSMVKLTEDASVDALIGTKTTTGSGYHIVQETTDVTSFTIVETPGAGGSSVTSPLSTDIDGVWAKVCATWDGSGDITRIYLNGVEEDNTDSANIGDCTTGAFFRMGADGAATADYDGNGLWSYQAVWDLVILTPAQINEFNWNPEIVGITPSMLIAVWGASSEKDLSPTNDPASITNTTTSTDGPAVMFGGGLPL